MTFTDTEKFSILFYNSKIPNRRVKENLNRYGSNQVKFMTDENNVTNTLNGLDPQVLIVHHHLWNESTTPLLLQNLRKSNDIPVIIWSDDINEFVSQKVLSFKNTYTLRLSDGFSALTEVLQRIEMKIKNPALWV